MSSEVEKIIAWLRAMDAERRGDNFCGWIAGMIERGEHLKGQDKAQPIEYSGYAEVVE